MLLKPKVSESISIGDHADQLLCRRGCGRNQIIKFNATNSDEEEAEDEEEEFRFYFRIIWNIQKWCYDPIVLHLGLIYAVTFHLIICQSVRHMSNH